MQEEQSQFPDQSTDDISLNAQDIQHIKKNQRNQFQMKIVNYNIQRTPQEVAKFYKFSNYLIDPNYRNFTTVVQIMA